MNMQTNEYFVGLNLGFAVNRYPEPYEWTDVVNTIGAKRVQFVADLLNPSLPKSHRIKKVDQILKFCEKFGITIESAFTGAFTRVNHFGSEDKEIREFWVEWFVEYAKQSAVLGASSIGGHPGILSLRNDLDPQTRRVRVKEIANCWGQVLEQVNPFGIDTILWEPMSISREIGHTIEDALEFQELLEDIGGESFKLCLDLDHGDIESVNPDDTNPISWIKCFKNKIGAIHLKQTTIDRRKNMSFTKGNNAIGTINGNEILSALEKSSIDSLSMYLELGFRERNPDDQNAIEENSISLEYWKSCGARLD